MSPRGPAALVIGALSAACSHIDSPATPASGLHPSPPAEWTEVATAPPTVEVEEIPSRPTPSHLWIDGQWAYQSVSRRWVWEPGRWCVPPTATLFYAPPALQRERRLVTDASGQPVRVSRWNTLLQRAEEFDQQTDRWRWHKGAFYVRGADGKPVVYAGTLVCG